MADHFHVRPGHSFPAARGLEAKEPHRRRRTWEGVIAVEADLRKYLSDPQTASAVSRFRVARYRIEMQAIDALSLPPFKGSTFRGAFGGAFRRVACAQRERPGCPGCLLHPTCPYGYVFETPVPPGAEKLRGYESVPRPFVLEPPGEARTGYAPGETLAAGLVLCGRAVALFPYFVVALREMGERGIGRGRGRFRVARITAEPPPGAREAPPVYDGAAGTVLAGDAALTGEQVVARALAAWGAASPAGAPAAPAAPRRVRLRFETPTRLKYDDRLRDRPEFHVLVRNLLRRLSSLAYFHHGFDLDLDFRGIIARAAAVRLVAGRTRWVDWERYSSRQDERMRMGGLVGEAVYEAPAAAWSEFLPLLALAEFTHVGKNVTFGLGRVRVRPE